MKTSTRTFNLLKPAFLLLLPSLLLGVSGTENVQVELMPQYTSLNKVSEILVGVRFQIKPKWHVYWKNPGDSGMSTKIEWDLSENIKLKETLWPAPIKIYLDPIMTYGYENEVFVLSSFKVSKIDQPTQLKARLKWLECAEICLPGKAELKMTINQGQSQPNPRFQEKLEKNKKYYPQKNIKLKASAGYQQENLELDISELDIKIDDQHDLYFFMDEPGIIQHTEKQEFRLSGSGLSVTLPLDPNHEKAEEKISGYLKISGDQGRKVYVHQIEADIEKSYQIYLIFLAVILLAFLWYRYKLKESTS